MPEFATESTGIPSTTELQTSPIADEVQEGNIQTRQEALSSFLTLGPASAAIGFVDTVGTSLGLTDDDTVEKSLKETFPVLGDYYSRNKQIAQTVGDLTGMFLPGMGALKAYQAGGRVFNSLVKGSNSKSLRAISHLFTSGKRKDQLMS